jgi:endonuclease/exonuclease/phosphatase family metal-dependent hydrolase
VSVTASAATNERVTVQVASYNVHGCVGVDGRRDPARVAAVVRRLEADVVGLQEVDGRRGMRQLEALAEATGMSATSGPTIRTGRGDYGNALLTRLPVDSVDRIDLSFRDYEPRGLLEVTAPVADARVRIMVTHLGLRRRERRAQLASLVARLRRRSADLDVLLGDLNEWWPGGRPMRQLHAVVGRTRRLRTYPAWLPLLSLDHVLVRPGHQLLTARAVDDPLARRASDHLPVVARIDLAAPREPTSVPSASRDPLA